MDARKRQVEAEAAAAGDSTAMCMHEVGTV